jgi:hypothetical protein
MNLYKVFHTGSIDENFNINKVYTFTIDNIYEENIINFITKPTGRNIKMFKEPTWRIKQIIEYIETNGIFFDKDYFIINIDEKITSHHQVKLKTLQYIRNIKLNELI